MGKTNDNHNASAKQSLSDAGRRRMAETVATVGLLVIAVSLAVPMANLFDDMWQRLMKWVYCAGAVIYTVARLIGATEKGGSMRLRRLRRMEFWAGIAFCIGSALWFYHASRLGDGLGMVLGVVRDTILFTLVGATLQVVSSWLISSQMRKEGLPRE